MINLRLSTILSTISEISKSRSNDRSLVPRLSKASRTIRDYPLDIADVYYDGRLKDLPGIDDMSYKLAKEYIESGKIKIYEELVSKYSEELIRIIRLSGLGAKRMFKIYDALNIKDVKGLKDKLIDSDSYKENSEVKDIISDFFIERLKDTLKYYDEIGRSLPRGYIENFIAKIKNELKRVKEIEKFKVVGSLRRKKSIVEDIDILILPKFNDLTFNLDRSEKLIKKLGLLDFIKELVGRDVRGENISARFKTDFDIDIEFIITSYKNWAVDLIYTTGSKKHVEKLEMLAKERGYFRNGRIRVGEEVNEFFKRKSQLSKRYEDYKVKNVSDNDLMEDNLLKDDFDIQEKLIYELLDIQYIPPELREDTGEVELARRFLLPKLIRVEDIKGDFHVHSSWSDGIISIEDMLKRIKKYNYEYIAISDHSKSNIYGNGLDEERILDKIKYVSDLNSKLKEVKILMGTEVEIRGVGKIDYTKDLLEKMDIVIGAMHTGFTRSREENTKSVISAIENRYVDIIAHPTGVVFGNRAPYPIDIDELIKAAGMRSKALEINSYFLRSDLNEENAREAKRSGVKLSINTDAHRPNNMDMIGLGVDIARRAGLEKEDVINTMSLEDVRRWKKQR